MCVYILHAATPLHQLTKVSKQRAYRLTRSLILTTKRPFRRIVSFSNPLNLHEQSTIWSAWCFLSPEVIVISRPEGVKHAPDLNCRRPCWTTERNEGIWCMREPVGGVPPLGNDRMHQEQANVAHRAKVTGGRDRETFSWATNEDATSMWRSFTWTMSFWTVDKRVHGSGRPECKREFVRRSYTHQIHGGRCGMWRRWPWVLRRALCTTPETSWHPIRAHRGVQFLYVLSVPRDWVLWPLSLAQVDRLKRSHTFVVAERFA